MLFAGGSPLAEPSSLIGRDSTSVITLHNGIMYQPKIKNPTQGRTHKVKESTEAHTVKESTQGHHQVKESTQGWSYHQVKKSTQGRDK